MPTDPSLEALAALRVAVRAFNDYHCETIEEEEGVENKRLEAASLMADHRYALTMPTTGVGIAAALEWLFFTEEDEQLADSCSQRTQRFIRLLIEAARRLDRCGRWRTPKPTPRPARLPENVAAFPGPAT